MVCDGNAMCVEGREGRQDDGIYVGEGEGGGL